MYDLSKLISNFDIENKLKGYNINIVIYSQLTNYSNLKELLPEDHCACFILVKTSESSGHWTVICRNGNNIYYCDSYGVKPDGELSHISASMRYQLHENKKLLTEIINNSKGFKVSYNLTQFQSYHADINTCGKWCVVFALSVLKGKNIKQFTSMMKKLTKSYELHHGKTEFVNDVVISLLYNEI